MSSDANQPNGPGGDSGQSPVDSWSEAIQMRPACPAAPDPPSLPPVKRKHLRLAGLALIAACLFLVFILTWLLIPHKPDPRNTPEILLAAGTSTKTMDLPQLSELKTELASA